MSRHARPLQVQRYDRLVSLAASSLQADGAQSAEYTYWNTPAGFDATGPSRQAATQPESINRWLERSQACIYRRLVLSRTQLRGMCRHPAWR